MNEIIEQSQNTLIQIILANTTSAMKISKVLCEHSEGNIMKPDDIICGLIYRLMIPMTDEEITESMNTAEDIMCDGASSEEDFLSRDIGCSDYDADSFLFYVCNSIYNKMQLKSSLFLSNSREHHSLCHQQEQVGPTD